MAYYNRRNDRKTGKESLRFSYTNNQLIDLDNKLRDKVDTGIMYKPYDDPFAKAYLLQQEWANIEKSLDEQTKSIDYITQMADRILDGFEWESEYDYSTNTHNYTYKKKDAKPTYIEQLEYELNGVSGKYPLQNPLRRIGKKIASVIYNIPRWLDYYFDKWFDEGFSVPKPSDIVIEAPETITVEEVKQVLHWCTIGASFYEYLSGRKFNWEETRINELTEYVKPLPE